MLARVDGAGVVRAGEYTLTRLATGIVDFFLEEETLTRESLTVLTRTLRASLADVLAAATAAALSRDTERWHDAVALPLRVTVGELVGGIQRRQRGFDVQQEELQREIASLLAADWFGAVDGCQSLLDTMSQTLRELNHVLLHDTHLMQGTLQEIQELAASADAGGAEEAARVVTDQLDRISEWGAARQRAWSDYYQYVHRFLRDVVRLDPTRVLTHRLREQLAGRSGRSFALKVAAAPPIRLLRAVTAPPSARPPVRRPKKEQSELTDAPPDDPQARLERDIRSAMAEGARTLHAVTATLTRELQPGERFVVAGRVAHTLAQVCRPDAHAERPWLPIYGGIVIEEWTVKEAP